MFVLHNVMTAKTFVREGLDRSQPNCICKAHCQLNAAVNERSTPCKETQRLM